MSRHRRLPPNERLLQAHVDQLRYLGGRDLEKNINELKKDPPKIGYAPLSDEEWREILDLLRNIELPENYGANVSNIRTFIDQSAVNSGHFSSLRYEMDRRVRLERKINEYNRTLALLGDAASSLGNLLADGIAGDPDLNIKYLTNEYHRSLEHIGIAIQKIISLKLSATRDVAVAPVRHNKSRKPTLENWAAILIDFWKIELQQNVENRTILQDFIRKCMSPYNQLSTRRQAGLLIKDYISGDLCRVDVSATQRFEARIPRTPDPDDT